MLVQPYEKSWLAANWLEDASNSLEDPVSACLLAWQTGLVKQTRDDNRCYELLNVLWSIFLLGFVQSCVQTRISSDPNELPLCQTEACIELLLWICRWESFLLVSVFQGTICKTVLLTFIWLIHLCFNLSLGGGGGYGNDRGGYGNDRGKWFFVFLLLGEVPDGRPV